MSPSAQRFLAFGLITVGALMTVLCGLCTGAVVVVFGLLPGENSVGIDDAALVRFALLAGGIPTLLGLAMIWLGRRFLRAAR